MAIKLELLLVFFAVIVGVGLYCRRHATDVSSFVLGGRFPAILHSPINAVAFCMLARLVIVPAFPLVTTKPDRQLVDKAFSCYDQTVLVRQRQALGKRE